MIHLRQYKKPRTRKSLIALMGVILILVLFIASESTSSFFSRLLTSFAGPFWEAPALLFQGTEESMRAQELEQEITTLRMRSLSRDLLVEENRQLKALLGREDTIPTTLLSVVLVKPTQTPYDTLIIDTGSDDKVKEGDRVLFGSDVVIGKVEKVYRSTSLVRLFSSPGEEIGVLVGERGLSATAYGRGGGNFIMEIPRGIEIKEGDVVFLPSLVIQILGVVSVVEKHPGSSFQKILFRSPVMMQHLRWVEVLIN
ncbi:MAG: rod shape-determining protein MreC [Candidatus Paceibacterota bacterium]